MRSFSRSVETPETFERTLRVESIDEASGVFEMTLATEGEASDGHILAIKGMRVAEKIPLFVSHMNDPTTQAGSITDAKKFLKEKPPRLRATGNIEMGGDGPSAEIRRDLAYMIAKGHVGAMSVRWDEVPGKSVRRINLPSGHQHYVDATQIGYEDPRYWGWFFEESVAREGSIVGLGADPIALIGRADETVGDVATFWRALAADAEANTGPVRIARALASLRYDAGAAVELGATIQDVINAVTHECNRTDETEMFQPVPFGESEIFFLPRALAEDLALRRSLQPVTLDGATGLVVYVSADRVADLAARKNSVQDPAPKEIPVEVTPESVPFDSKRVAAFLVAEFDRRDENLRDEIRTLLDSVRGKVTL